MKQPNLDALAKLGPFRSTDDYCEAPGDIAAALNEWVQLRAYRERTEAALARICRQAGNSPIDYEFLNTADLLGAGLWRDPAPEENE